MECNFIVGQKVVCVKDSTRTVNDLGFPGFKKGQIFTISSIDTVSLFGNDEIFLSFLERSPLNKAHYKGFKPLEKKKTDISIFKRMLANKFVKVGA